MNNERGLLEFVSAQFPQSDLSRVLVVGCQHLLSTQYELFRELCARGLVPEHFAIIGKCYSTNEEIVRAFLLDGANVSPHSKSFDSYRSFDDQFSEYVEKFISGLIKKYDPAKFSKLIILDDGGHVLERADAFLSAGFRTILGIEQTSSGFNRLARHPLTFPVINVARSSVKLNVESEFIAENAAVRISEYFNAARITRPRILIVGEGPIGRALQHQLADHYPLTTYDIASSSQHVSHHLGNVDVIIGATGEAAISTDTLHAMAHDMHLISVSSSDREFPSVEIRRQQPLNHDPHAYVVAGTTHLVNSGFPINFDGRRDSLPPVQARLTMALMLAGIHEANIKALPPGLANLSDQIQARILSTFWTINENNDALDVHPGEAPETPQRSSRFPI